MTDCNGMMCNQGGCQMYFGLRLQKNIMSANIFGASTVSGVAPTLKACKLFKWGLWNLAQDTHRGVCLLRSTGIHCCGQPRHGRFPYVFGALLNFLRGIEIFMTNWAHVYGIFFLIVCAVSQLQEEGIKIRDHIGLQGDRQIPWVGWKQHLNCCVNKAS